MQSSKLGKFVISFTYFIDYLSWAIVFPVFAPLFMGDFFQIGAKTTIFGFFLAVFSFFQFLGSPILGEFADRKGRKNAFILSIFFVFVGYIISAIGVGFRNLPLLFVGRAVTGLFSGSLAVCLAAVSDLSESESEKTRSFGYFSALGGLSFIAGTFLGGKFSDEKISSLFFPALPLWIAAFLSFINLVFIFFAFKETLLVVKHKKLDPLEGVHNVQQALEIRSIKSIYLIYFLFLMGWTLIFQFAPVLAINKFQFTNSQIGNMASFMGICWIFGSISAGRKELKKISQFRVLEICLLAFTVLCGAISFPEKEFFILVILGLSVFIGGIAWPVCTALISNLATKNVQGKILGISQSIYSFSMFISPILGGFVGEFNIFLPFILASFFSFSAAVVYFSIKRRKF